MDPISTIKGIIGIIQDVKALKDQVEANKKKCIRLSNRLSDIVPSLESLANSHPKEKQLRYRLQLSSLYELVREIQTYIIGYCNKGYIWKAISRNADDSTFASQISIELWMRKCFLCS